jgi:cytochrome P450
LSDKLKDLKEKELEKGGRTKERYIFLEALAQQTRDPIELRSQLLNILLAGRDTTAGLLGWLFYILARNPAAFKKLRETIMDEFGSYTSPNEITFARLKSCSYLQHCLNETLRLYAVVPVNSRCAVRDTTLPRGGGPDGKSKVFVHKGQEVNYSVHVMHRRKDLWGEDADEFKPERWVGLKPGWEYLPFNGGPRICLGRKLTPLHLNRSLTDLHIRAIRLDGSVLCGGQNAATV